jgi:hypothetical protein
MNYHDVTSERLLIMFENMKRLDGLLYRRFLAYVGAASPVKLGFGHFPNTKTKILLNLPPLHSFTRELKSDLHQILTVA